MSQLELALTDLGRRDSNEDRYTIITLDETCKIIAVFDGHGGDEIANYCALNFEAKLRTILLDEDPMSKDPKSRTANMGEILKNTLAALDNDAQICMPKSTAGTTACVTCITPNSLITLNLGDSRAVLVGRDYVTDLSRDHRPSDPDEQQRVKDVGGFIVCNRLMGMMGLTRALGDWEIRPFVSAEPDVTVYSRRHDDEFLVLATDGVWDVLSSCEVAKMLQRFSDNHHQGLSLEYVLERLKRRCRRLGSHDNITVVISVLKCNE